MSRFTSARRSAFADTLITPFNSGKLRIYNGTRPTDANTALAGNTLLAELTFNATSAPASSNGVLTFNAITQDSSADASGTATFVRCFQSDGTTVICDLSVSVTGGGGECQLSSLAIVAATPVSASSCVISFPVGS